MTSEASGMMAPPIGPNSWLQEDRFDAFRAAYAYASNRTQAIPGLSRLTPEDAYYVYRALHRGHLRQEPTAEERGRLLFGALADDLWGMPSMSGLTWGELGPEVRAMWEQAADAVAAHG